MRRSGAVALLLIGAVVSACGPDVGYRGARDDSVLVVRFIPVPGFRNVVDGAPRVAIKTYYQNRTDRNVTFTNCSATAFDAVGDTLFRIGPLGGNHYPMEPFEVAWDPGYTRQNIPTPPSVTMRAVQAVDHYEARCEAYNWEGPLPPVNDS